MSKVLNLLLLILLFSSLSTNAFAVKKKPVITTESKPTEQSEPTTTSQDKIIPGRYQLFQGKYKSSEIVIGASSKTEYVEGLFLLDTANGELFLCEGLNYANSESNSKAVKGLLYKRSCSPFTDEMRALKDE